MPPLYVSKFFMPAPPIVLSLVEKFHEHIDQYKSGRYNETQVRREFVDPLFTALGWDVDNTAGYAQAYQDVIHEDAVRIGGSTKAPDYSFRIGGMRKFFVEAKKPSVNVKGDPVPAYQVRRYAWSAKLPLSIVTDFEELAVYDCRTRPKETDKASKDRTLYFTYDQYEARWDELAAIFSREAILKGSFDKYAASKKKRGTAEVDDEFLKEIERWRDALARNVALRNSLSQREVNFAVQRTSDRIIFLRICEDRGIEPPGQLQGRANGRSVYKKLAELFRDADAKYNSGLFHFEPEKGRPGDPDELSLSLAVDDKVLKDIIGNLYYPQSPYEFSVLPADILGQVYEQFLGKVIRLTPSGQAKVEEKPEVRKAGGVYYTPTYIVDYIVENTVGKLVDGKSPQEISGRTKTFKPAKGKRPMSVLDPACGSGSFLIGAYQFLLDWHLKWYTENDPEKFARGKEPRIYEVAGEAAGGGYRLTTNERKRILLDHIYGVDIDPQAVEVTKLSLLLKVLEGETSDTLQRQLFAKERALPDLAANIKCGNSLIGHNFWRDQQLELFDEEERLRINTFEWKDEFPNIFKGDNPGFDAVIGNPPYVRSINLKEMYPTLWNLYRNTYSVAASREWDIYLIFVEKGLQLLSPEGLLGYILPNKFINSQVGRALRALLAKGKHVRSIAHFGAFQVFTGATTYTCVLNVSKRRAPRVSFSRYRGPLKTEDGRCPIPPDAASGWTIAVVDAADLSESAWDFAIVSAPIARAVQRFPTLDSQFDVFKGTGTNADKVYVVNLIRGGDRKAEVYSPELDRHVEVEVDLLRPVLRGRSIDGYHQVEADVGLVLQY